MGFYDFMNYGSVEDSTSGEVNILTFLRTGFFIAYFEDRKRDMIRGGNFMHKTHCIWFVGFDVYGFPSADGLVGLPAAVRAPLN